ncbi:MAG: 1-deoxy-D-xylulose-5-phosphate synthase [Candidatus Omnitrophica bacterium]|nr:1-deoxy-D-xylulose-5-phosphate synthase [Candidatus Omnitrophota bacterium]
MYKILDSINSPQDLRILSREERELLAREMREFIVDTVSKTGGHLAPSLGAIEIAVALHYCLNTPYDKIVWDVGHQAYAHKVLTGRREKFKTIRQFGGLSGFPNAFESEYDTFTVGHGSTSISAALGLAKARDITGESYKVVAVIGDGSLGGGMALEALNDAGHSKTDILIILNDNEMSIAPSVGAFSKYLNKILVNPTYNKIHKDMEGLIKRVPWYGFRVYRAAKKLEESMKGMLIPGMLFEELGLRYIGPIDGNNLEGLIKTIDGALRLEGPILIHALTKKGKGYHHAEKRPEKFHGTAPFDVETGELKASGASSAKSFTETFSEALVEIARDNPKVAAVTAAMPEGTGLDAFQKEYPTRFFNVGMAEQHAVTFAAGLAKGGVVPVVAIYSTFMQRSYDQIIHDTCLQNLHVVFCLDRAGIVGEDGATHHGIFDIAFMRHMPNMTLLAPKDQAELKGMLEYAVNRCEGPVAIRYPRGKIVAPPVLETDTPIVRGKAEVMSKEGELAILAVGSMVWPACAAAGLLFSEGIKTSLINVRFIKPIDEELLKGLAARTKKFVTVEEGVLEGGFGSAVLEFFERERMSDISVKRLGFPAKFVEHGRKEDLFKAYGLDAQGIASEIKKMFSKGKAVRA